MRELLSERPNHINPGTGTSQDEFAEDIFSGATGASGEDESSIKVDDEPTEGSGASDEDFITRGAREMEKADLDGEDSSIEISIPKMIDPKKAPAKSSTVKIKAESKKTKA